MFRRNWFIADMVAFHEKYGLAYNGPPRELPVELSHFRQKFLQEELDEYKKCSEEGDLEGQFDALVDLAVVLFGTAILQGLPFEAGWHRVMEANNKKVRATKASDSKRNSTFDIVKPEGWQSPVLSDLLETSDD
jgi:predicted HAD superfamily Cof-like phosphohydrolase